MSILITDFDKIETTPSKSGINLIGQDESNYLSLYPTYHDSIFVITSKEPINTIIRIEEGTKAYNSFDIMFNDIMKKYKEESKYSKERYESVNFIDIYNNVITFFSDSRPLKEANAFIIKKYVDKEIHYFEVCYYCKKENDNVELYDHVGGGNYYQYYQFLIQLCHNLYCDLNNIDGYSKTKN